MLKQIESIAAQHHAKRVSRVVLQLGPLSGVESVLLEHAFPIAVAGTIAESAKLQIEQLPIRIKCTQCLAESEADINRLLCRQCGSWQVRLISGDEMLLASLEFESENKNAKPRKQVSKKSTRATTEGKHYV